jgi:Cu+-exporting ATPase
MTKAFKDPVCGMEVSPESAAGISELYGKTYYFCSLECKEAFDQESERYLGQTAPAHLHSH